MPTNALAEVTQLPAEAENEAAVVLQKLSERHKTAAALLAQGIQRQVIAAAVNYTPEYITWLQRQPLFITYVREMSAAAATRLEAMFDQSVDVIAETMQHGTEDGKLKAVKMQLEATGRVGRDAERDRPQSGDRLDMLAERLVTLLQTQRKRVYDGEVTEAEIIREEKAVQGP